MIYLDNNATTALDLHVLAAIDAAARRPAANPASQHRLGREARASIEASAETILKAAGGRAAGMDADRLIFCSGGTEANNLALLGVPSEIAGSLVVSSIEHASVIAAAELAHRRGRRVEWIPCLPSGVIDVDWIERRLAAGEPIAAVAVMSANNETGVLQPVERIGRRCREAGVRFHVDAVQSLGKSSVDFAGWSADSMTLCGHKLHGPVGIGALVHRAGVKFEPQIVGGAQQGALRGGTESVMLPAGFAAAVEVARLDADRGERMRDLRDRFEVSLRDRLAGSLVEPHVIGGESDRLPNTSCIAFPPLDRQALQMALDFAGVACSTGSACESGSSTPSHVLLAMGLNESLVRSALRFSLGADTTAGEVDEAVERVGGCVERLYKTQAAKAGRGG